MRHAVTDAIEADVVAIGHAGDGVVRVDGQTHHFPGAVTGDRVRLRAAGKAGFTLVDIVAQSPHRIPAVCQHFGTCGGCVAQHFDASTYQTWRHDQVAAPLLQRGFAVPPVEPVVAVAPGARRRATFAWRARQGGVDLGFRERGAHRIVPMAMCPALHPGIVARLGDVRGLALRLDNAGRLDVTHCDNGLDITVEQKREPALAMREAMGAFVEATDAVRLSWRAGQGGPAETVVQRGTPIVTVAGVPVALPAAAFLQPSVAGEALLQRLVLEMIGKARRVADLFCGCGTLALALAQRGTVVAVDSDESAIAALRAAGGAAGGRGLSIALRAEVRDLFRRPLQGAELSGFDAVVFDPPRAGAVAQAAALAESKVKTVVAVSCNPATFARDARLLVDGGFTLRRVVPIDQFVWSQHVEVVAQFSR